MGLPWWWCRQLFGLSVLYLLLFQADAAMLPSPTASSHIIAAEFAPRTTGAASLSDRHNVIDRRATTSGPEPSVCGYFDGDKRITLSLPALSRCY